MSMRLDIRARGHAGLTRAGAVLGLLGRVEFARAHWVHRLLFADQTPRRARQVLRELHAAQLIWCASAPARRVPGAVGSPNGQPPPIPPQVYGLTPEGRAALDTFGLVPAGADLAGLPVRPWADPDLRLAQLRHDLLVSDWCCAVLAGVRKHPQLHAVACQVEYISATNERGQAMQRFDALVVVTLAPRSPAVRPAPWAIPWAEGPDVPDGSVVCRLAAEIDTGSEKLAILMGKAGMYRALTLAGHYTATLGGPVLPVVLVPGGTRRAGQVAREWQDGWPDGAGVIASVAQAQVQGDAVVGRYLAMASRPAREVFLLEAFGVTRQSWEAATARR
ncbi:hypothetical protein F8S13_22595 [Chloroflexia bacterium SDU3-3]|nr:hypothetical protein F8S13_22595 [Chloroflexia bacterium SDU3-3]